MTTLRVLLADAPRADRPDDWALHGDDGRMLRCGRGVPADWPSARQRVGVLAAARARLVTLDLPPMSPERLAPAAGFALEDRLAQAGDPPRVAIGAQRADGSVDAAIAERSLVEAIAQDGAFARLVPEAALTASDGGWTWYASDAGGGFVRTPAGTFGADPGEMLPPELAVALAQAQRTGAAPEGVHVAFTCTPGALAAWSRDSGTPFTAVAPWQWHDASAAMLAIAPDWLAPAPAARRARRAGLHPWRIAIALAAAALLLHIGGTLAEWLGYRIATWQAGRDLVALARAAGIGDAATPTAAVAALVKADADRRHAAGEQAPADALPLLARAAPSLATLPANAIKSATYGAGAWTLELAVPPGALEPVDQALRRAGVAVLQADVAGGTRMRLTALP